MSQVEKSTDITFNTVLEKDGNVRFTFLADGKEVFSAVCNPEQVGTLATGLLAAVSGSSRLGNRPPPQMTGGTVNLDAFIPVMGWFFGEFPRSDQKAVGVQIGGAKIGFAIEPDRMRDLGRTIIAASWKSKSPFSSFALLLSVLKDFLGDLRAWSSVATLRLVSSWKHRWFLFSNFISGRAFIPFRAVVIAPGVAAPTYSPVQKCIYCGTDVYSTNPQIRKYPLGAEHIIAEGLGGNLELPQASCQRCETATGAVVEGDVLGRTMKALRVHFKLRKRGSGPLPKTLPLEATIFGQNKKIELPIEDYPIVFSMFDFAPPDIEGHGGTPLVVNASLVRLKHDEKELFQKYGIGAFATAYWDSHMVCRMLAKIGHAFAVAELGLDKFSPLLSKLIQTNDDPAAMRFVGGDKTASRTEKPSTLHRLTLGFQKISGKVFVVARIRLFASYGSPIYSVIVGESLDTPMARFKKVLSGRISQYARSSAALR